MLPPPHTPADHCKHTQSALQGTERVYRSIHKINDVVEAHATVYGMGRLFNNNIAKYKSVRRFDLEDLCLYLCD